MARRIKLNRAGIAAIMKGAEMQAAINATAEQVAANLRGQKIKVGALKGGDEIDLPVTVRSGITDRARATVVIAHPAGMAVQAKHGALTKAAAEAGLEVKSKSS